MSPTICRPVYPDQGIRVNTVFEVAKAHGMRTAWSDKHPAYEMLKDDLFTPEMNSVADNAGDDWTTRNALTMGYDSTKVVAILNEIHGRDHAATHEVGIPAMFGTDALPGLDRKAPPWRGWGSR